MAHLWFSFERNRLKTLTLTLGIAGATGVGAIATIPACGFRVANAERKNFM